MKIILAACTAAFLATAALAAGPGDGMAPAGQTPPTGDTAPANSLPASATPSTTSCADMITQARGMALPSDPDKARLVRDEIAAADDAGDDATCRSHEQNALNAMGGM
ncbi:MAG: hypothetical protein WDM91_04530 [Rhizomicrobium sp.]